MTSILGKIEVIFFDLDNTLHDNSKGMALALQKTYQQFQERLAPVTEEEFLEAHRKLVVKLVREYQAGVLQEAAPWEATYRFQQMFKQLKLPNKGLVAELAETFNGLRRECVQLYPGVKDLLNRLKPHYQIAILSNGPSDLQRKKLRWLSLYETFDWIFISGEIGYNKPDVRVFQYVVRATRVKPEESVMIGDTVEADLAAKQLRMKTLLFDPTKAYTTHEFSKFPPNAIVSSYKELQEIFFHEIDSR